MNVYFLSLVTSSQLETKSHQVDFGEDYYTNGYQYLILFNNSTSRKRSCCPDWKTGRNKEYKWYPSSFSFCLDDLRFDLERKSRNVWSVKFQKETFIGSFELRKSMFEDQIGEVIRYLKLPKLNLIFRWWIVFFFS